MDRLSGGEKDPSLLSSLSASLLLLRAVRLACLLLDTVDLLNHEGARDSTQERSEVSKIDKETLKVRSLTWLTCL